MSHDVCVPALSAPVRKKINSSKPRSSLTASYLQQKSNASLIANKEEICQVISQLLS